MNTPSAELRLLFLPLGRGYPYPRDAPPVPSAANQNRLECTCLAELLVLRIVLRRVAGHAALWHSWVLIRRLLLLEVLLVVEGGFGRHVRWWRHVGGHAARLAGRHLSVVVLGRVYRGVAIDAICVVGRRLRRVQAGLRQSVLRVTMARESRVQVRTWMRFLPSGLVTKGCSLGVVKV